MLRERLGRVFQEMRRMVGRLVILKLVVLTLLVIAPARAQYFTQPPRQQSLPAGVSPASYAAGAWADAVPAGPVIHERMLSQDRGWSYEDTHLDRVLGSLVRNSWMRLEYMNFDAKQPGSHLLGADNPMVADLRRPFTVTIGNGNLDNILGVATVPSLDLLQLKNVNGMRGTVGVMLTDGGLEFNVWGLKENSASLSITGLGAQEFGPTPGGNQPIQPVFVATSTELNGAPGNNFFLYDHSFGARYDQDVWGAGINYIADDSNVGEGLKLMPILGFRYLAVNEGLFQVGVFNGGFDGWGGPITGSNDLGEDANSNGVLDVGEDLNDDGLLDLGLVSMINSRVNNEIYAPQIGMRLQLQHRWFTVGFEPKVALGVNRYEMEVETYRLRSFGDGLVRETKRNARFAQVADFRFFLKLFPAEDIQFFLAYDVTVAGGVSRAHDNIYYNDNGQSEPPAIGVEPGFEVVWWQGLTIGGQIWLR